MRLFLGSHVREHGHRVGRVAGFELEPGQRIRRIIFSPDSELGPHAMTRPLAQIASIDRDTIVLRDDADIAPLPAVPDVVLLSRSTRVRRDGKEIGRFAGVEVDDTDRRVVSVFGRQHWWSKRFAIAAADADCSEPGEIRIRAAGASHAA